MIHHSAELLDNRNCNLFIAIVNFVNYKLTIVKQILYRLDINTRKKSNDKGEKRFVGNVNVRCICIWL